MGELNAKMQVDFFTYSSDITSDLWKVYTPSVFYR